MKPPKKILNVSNSESVDSSQLDFTRSLKSEKIQKKHRRFLLFIFFFTVLLSLAFYLFRHLSLLIISLPTISSVKSALFLPENIPFFKSSSLSDRLTKKIKSYRGNWAISIKVLRGSDYSFSYQADQIFPAASLKKLLIAEKYCESINNHHLQPDASYVVQSSDLLPGAGLLSREPPGKTYSNQELLRLALSQSDNSAAAILARRLDLSQTAYSDNQTTAQSVESYFSGLYQSKDQPCPRDVIAFLTQTAFENLIPAGLPKAITVAHKVAEEKNYLADAGLIFTPDLDYSLTIIADQVDRYLAETIFPELSRLIYLSLVNRPP